MQCTEFLHMETMTQTKVKDCSFRAYKCYISIGGTVVTLVETQSVQVLKQFLLDKRMAGTVGKSTTYNKTDVASIRVSTTETK